MDTNIRRLLKEIGAEDLIEVFAPCMDDYLYIIDLQKNTLIISQAAVKRFKMPGNSFDNAADSVRYFVYEEDRPMIREHLQRIADGNEKNHNLHYRWLDKEDMPVWINCRGKVIHDKDGKPHYLIGCVNEIGNIQRADNVSGLLGEREMHSFVSSHIKDSSSVFLIHIGIDGFNAINGTLGVDYGNYVLKSVADGIKECLSDNQQLYHLVADEYMIVDLESHTRDDVMLLQKEICKKIEEFIISLGKTLDKNEYEEKGENIWIAKSAKVAPTAYIAGPAIIGKNAEIRHCAFIRGKAIVGEGAVVGNSTELKNVILFNKVQVPHYNYVGDSILGYKSHMGAGSITSNVKSDKKLVIVKNDKEQIETGLKKFGAMLGDEVEVGCSSVLNPGTVIGKHTNIYPLSSVRGVVPEHSIYKNQKEIVEKID